MLICQCKWLTFKQLCDVVAAGADSVAAMQQQCGAGTECGGCVPVLQQMVNEASAQAAPCSTEEAPGTTAPRIDISAA